MAGQYEELSCPFCDKGRIPCLYFPSTSYTKKKKTATFGSKKEFLKTSETWIIKSGCNFCGKSQEEVEKELRKKEII